MIEDDLLKKWLNNELTDAEKQPFSERDDYKLNQNIIDKASHFKASHFNEVKDFDAFESAYNKTKSTKNQHWIRPFLRIASVLTIGLAVYFTVFNNDLVEERTLVSEKTTINLPDLSKVSLNADSEITYSADNWDSKRSLNLKGEAYFKVEKGKTFDIITESGTVTVVGTEFNVNVRANYFEVICYEGIVKVSSDTITKHLYAGDTFRVLDKVFSQDKITELTPQWTNNRSSFKSVPFSNVIDELERQYGVKVVLKKAKADRLFSGVFAHNNLEAALKSITQPMNLAYTISSSNQVLINGNTN